MKIHTSKWLFPEPIIVSENLFQAAGNRSFLAEILSRRGIADPYIAKAFLDPEFYIPAPPEQLPDLELAVSMIRDAIKNHSRIGVWGDFDVDGQTSTTILVSALQKLGADVVFHIPVRSKESHGISIPYLKEFLNLGVELLITCDTGISAHEAADFARSVQVKMIITDHHLLPDTLPSAAAILNPKRLPANHPLTSLSGAGVAYKLVEALLSQSSLQDELPKLRDLVALGLIADQAELQADTRFLVQQGLLTLQKSDRLAITELLDLLEINQPNVSEEHVGFYLAPRLNALGRLSDANPVVPFFMSSDPKFTHEFALNLEALNQQRKMLSDQVFQAATAQISASREIRDAPVIILNHPSWPAGVIGIVASQLMEIYNRPVILLTSSVEGIVHGSARSINSIDITEAIASQKENLVSFGGHAGAAGLSIDIDKLPVFQRGISRFINEKTKGQPFEKIRTIDAFLQLSDIDLDLVKTIEKLAPFGNGNPAPLFVAQSLVVKNSQVIGKSLEHRLVNVEDQSGQIQKVLWWKGADLPLPDGLFDLAFALRASNYHGQINSQVEWVDAHPTESKPITIKSKLEYDVIDYRHIKEPFPIIQEMSGDESVELYWSGQRSAKLAIKKTEKTIGVEKMAIVTIPPGRLELLRIIAEHHPRKVFLFGITPSPQDQVQPFLRYLAGLAKFAIREKKGVVKLSEFIALTGQKGETILSGFRWLAAEGDIKFTITGNNEIQMGTPGIKNNSQLEVVRKELELLLSETRAFRSYYLRAELNNLLQPD